MRWTGTDRRTLLKGLAATALLLRTGGGAHGAGPGPYYLSSIATAPDAYGAAVFDAAGSIVATIDLPARGHGGCFRPRGTEAIVFARRPGDFAVVFDRRSGTILHTLHCPDDRHFYGHGVFDADGRLLHTTENDYDAGRGVIGVWDASRDYARVGEFDSGGIGPHEIVLMPDGRTLAVANGGLLTHPDTGRHKLNVPEMRPSLVLIDSADGRLVQRVELPRELHKLSIRHLAVTPSRQAAVAMQYEGPEGDSPPLVFIWSGGGPRLLEAPPAVQSRMRNYTGSIAAGRDGRTFAVTAPRGGLTAFWSADGRFLGAADMTDVCGVAAAARTGAFVLSSGTGDRAVYGAGDVRAGRPLPASQLRWDNHIAALADDPAIPAAGADAIR